MARVQRGFACIVVIASACAPDVSDTAFRCDTDRGGDRGCTSGQRCVYGRCRRGGATGTVICGATVCGEADQCCVDGANDPRCIAADATCPGAAALCDGRSDCAGGDFCCSGDTTACGGSCDATACVEASDCPSPQPNCCPGSDVSGFAVPWGECSARPCT